MANEIRSRTNFLFGTITDNPLAIGATTINSATFTSLPVIDATNHLILVLDPNGLNGAPEIVRVTTHTVNATSVTVQRAQEGSTARQHNTATTWYHAPTVADYNFTDVAALSTNRPASPTQGQLIYETDTNSYVGRAAGSVWQTVAPLGAWTAYTPTDLNITVGNGTRDAAFARIGRIIHVRWRLVGGTTSSITGAASIGLPVPAIAGEWPLAAHYLDGATRNWVGVAAIGRVSNVLASLLQTEAGGNGAVDATNPFAFGNTDVIGVQGIYEAAS